MRKKPNMYQEHTKAISAVGSPVNNESPKTNMTITKNESMKNESMRHSNNAYPERINRDGHDGSYNRTLLVH